MCNNCNKRITTKRSLINHITKCEQGVLDTLTCRWCNLKFKNCGNLASHALRMHGDSSYQQNKKFNGKFQCNVCQSSYPQLCLLKYHIRKAHFNLTSHPPYCELQKVNQVWFERVLNTNIIVEMRKMDHNTIIIKKLDGSLNVQVLEKYRKLIDLRSVYPIGRSMERVTCHLCKKIYVKRDMKKHMDEKHCKIAKHKCNNCCRTFKRSYAFLKHVCNKVWKMPGVKHQRESIKIASVESLSIPL